MRECAQTYRRGEAGVQRALGSPLALELQQLLCPPLHHHSDPPLLLPPLPGARVTQPLPESAASPACHVTGGRQSGCVTILKPAPGCGNHNIILSSLSRRNSPPPRHYNIQHRNATEFNLQMFRVIVAFYQSAAATSWGLNPLQFDTHPSLNQDGVYTDCYTGTGFP